MSVIEERAAGENQQWRNSPTGCDDWVGVWGRRSLPH